MIKNIVTDQHNFARLLAR